MLASGCGNLCFVRTPEPHATDRTGISYVVVSLLQNDTTTNISASTPSRGCSTFPLWLFAIAASLHVWNTASRGQADGTNGQPRHNSYCIHAIKMVHLLKFVLFLEHVQRDVCLHGWKRLQSTRSSDHAIRVMHSRRAPRPQPVVVRARSKLTMAIHGICLHLRLSMSSSSHLISVTVVCRAFSTSVTCSPGHATSRLETRDGIGSMAGATRTFFPLRMRPSLIEPSLIEPPA